MNFRRGIYFCILLFAMVIADASPSQSLVQQVQDPVADLISLPFQNNTYFGIEPYDRTENILNIQPVIPFHISEHWNLITRTILPVMSQPNPSPSGYTNGLGDLNPTFFLSPVDFGKIIWGVGPTFSVPTATNSVLGSGKWGAGPAVVVVVMPGHWVLGFLANNIWSFAGDTHRQNVNLGTLQYFINYNLPKGWYIVSSPIVTADWAAPAGQCWTVPVGGGFGRIFNIGKQPLNLTLQGFYNVKTPTNGPDWSMRLQLQFLFPK